MGRGAALHIVVDDAVLAGDAAFEVFGQVTRLPGPEIDGDALRDADALVIRSVTRVDEHLLADCPRLAFVGSATAGVDHIERESLEARGIRFAHAPGCNANAVCDWVTANLFSAMQAGPEPWSHGPVGIVGVGQVGSRVLARLRGLGLEALGCDPLRARKGFDSVDFAELRRRCGVLSFHVPLTRGGADATHHMISDEDDESVPAIINTSRGAVLSNERLGAAPPGTLILDVFEGEPDVPWSMLRPGGPVWRASPHVAGYSLEGKVAATAAIHRAMADWCNRRPSWSWVEEHPGPFGPRCSVGGRVFADPLAAFVECLESVVPSPRDDAWLRALAAEPHGDRARGFEQLRRGYSLRREFRAHRLMIESGGGLETHLCAPLLPGGRCTLAQALRAVGFELEESD
jgi:erythronate-4-phosphate dehydrogenase